MRLTILAFVLLLLTLTARSATFVVTNNADSGPATLREALTLAAANGSTDRDFISFNLPVTTQAGRTIILLSQLPAVPANVTIDGSTQPGANLGISTSKVIIETAFTDRNSFYAFRVAGVENIEIYGLCIRNGTSGLNRDTRRGIIINASRNVRIGAAGKGNVIYGFKAPVSTNVAEIPGSYASYIENLSVKANFFSIEPDGTTYASLSNSPLELNHVYGQVEVGGTPAEGNLLATGVRVFQLNDSDSPDPADAPYTLPAVITLQNNKVGVDYNVTRMLDAAKGIAVESFNPGGKNTVIVEDNVISAEERGLHIVNIGGPVDIRRNYMGTDKTLTRSFPRIGSGIMIYVSDNVRIGSDSPADANYIGHCKPLLVLPYSTVAVNKNSFFCTMAGYPMHYLSGTRTYPKVEILSVGADAVSGKATPNSVIELFYSDDCGTCSPKTYFGTTTTEADGTWTYRGPITGTVIASATLNNATSEFTRVAIDVSNMVISNTCDNTGAIRGVVPISATAWQWVDESGNVLTTSTELLNVPPGKYKFQVSNGNCTTETPLIQVLPGFLMNPLTVDIVNPSCGVANGSISNLSVINNTGSPVSYSWKDANGNEVATTIDLSNVNSGTYTLYISTATGNCFETYGPTVLTNSNGPAINETGLTVSPSVCNGNTGSIRGITATGAGALTYTWKNEFGTTVSAARELLNAPGGTYTLEVRDASSCPAVISSTFTIPETNAVIIGDAGAVSPASCTQDDGSISGITATGATRYQWFESSGNPLPGSTDIDLYNVPPGSYYLVASNSTCSRRSKLYTVQRTQNTTDYGQPLIELKHPSCGLNNGSVRLTFTGTLPAGYRWEDKSTGLPIGSNTPSLESLDMGVYRLYVTNANSCERLFAEYTLTREPELNLLVNDLTIRSDNCGLSEGAITGIRASGKDPISYHWTNEQGQVLSRQPDLTGLGEGLYKLHITDGTGCERSVTYNIRNNTQTIPDPDIADIELCSAGPAFLLVANVSADYGYKLYESAASTRPLDVQSSGRFIVDVQEERSFYVSQFLGTCESNRREVKIRLGTAAVKIPKAFSPNGDGQNDTWILKGIENYPRPDVQIFNRYGEKIYSSISYSTPFDGNHRGSPLPVGTYYYIIRLSSDCRNITGNLVIIR